MKKIHSTTVIGLIHNNQVAIGADGQATMGNTIIKANVKKVRFLAQNSILVGFAGATADAFTLLDRFEDKLSQYKNNMKRAAIELAKEWRTDRFLRRLEAMIVTLNSQEALIISGTGDVLEPEHQICAIGSGAMYAYSAAMALKKHAPHLSAREIVREALHIAADICIYTNHNFEILTLDLNQKAG
ncbi:MAG: ATP-dependent protease subunit HslV [Bacteroidia bacterium]|nr:ATP-dependent protease subunit HslV [Bacteroidia bacterium]MDW8301071.1 ATP-dependent protease subunit HslV [Bacteroidia bacterium]